MIPLLCLFGSPPVPAASESTGAVLGEQFYRSGAVPPGDSSSLRLAGSAQLLPTTTLPCQACHGAHGEGGNEAGLTAPDLRPASLDRPRTQGLRPRPAYSRSLLVRAITQGIDSAGAPLDPTMPRYVLTLQTANHLLAWLQIMDRSSDPGIEADAVVLAWHGPDPTPSLVETRGFYGRRLRWLDAGHSPERAFLSIDTSTDGSATLQAAGTLGRPALVLHAQIDPGPTGFVLLDAGHDSQRSALQLHGDTQGLRYLLDPPCSILPAATALFYTQMAAARCPAPTMDGVAGVRSPVVVALAQPPDAEFQKHATRVLLNLVQEALSDLGRQPTRAGLVQWLERQRRAQDAHLPALRWAPGRHVGARGAWLMTLAPDEDALQSHPGWVDAAIRAQR